MNQIYSTIFFIYIFLLLKINGIYKFYNLNSLSKLYFGFDEQSNMMEGEQFSLCWNNFHSNLSSGFQSLLKDETLVDVTLAAEGKFLKAHKAVLSVCSPFFKELFRVNPCKHPIVILPDVNYQALCHVLHFMYQGEVSVSQEEIPTFMRVAETLKVKGLTDNARGDGSCNMAVESNGFDIDHTDHNQRHIMKRSRPAKKLIKPVTHLRPLDGGTGFPVAKRPHLLHERETKVENADEKTPPIVTPKQEPKDVDDAVSIGNSSEATQIEHDLRTSSATVDESIVEGNSMSSEGSAGLGILPAPSPSNLHLYTEYKHDSSPGTLKCILGRRGNPRLILDGFVFFKKSTYKGKAFWYCKNNRMNKCPAVCWTQNGNIVKWPQNHSHSVIPDLFNPEEDTEVPIENLQDVLWQTSAT